MEISRGFDTSRAAITNYALDLLPYNVEVARRIDTSQIGKANFTRDFIGRPVFMDFVLGGVHFANEPLITFSKRKNIVETIVVGSERKGTVKEFINSEDYNIKVQGVVINLNKGYPEEEVEAITQVCERNEALDFENQLADLLGISRVVITDYGFSNMKGKPYSQAYFINMVSDEDFFATLNNRGL